MQDMQEPDDQQCCRSLEHKSVKLRLGLHSLLRQQPRR